MGYRQMVRPMVLIHVLQVRILLAQLAYDIGKDCFVSFLCLFLREKRGSICESSGTVRFRRARNRPTLRPAYKVATDHRVYVWAHGTAKVYKYENAVVRGIKLYVHPQQLENRMVKLLSLTPLCDAVLLHMVYVQRLWVRLLPSVLQIIILY